MNALLFPGQGSQIVGMGSEFYKNFSLVKKLFDQADTKLKFPISKMILEGPEDQLQLTENTQPAILTVSYSIFKVLQKEFGIDFKSFEYFAGHSLGEYSALVSAEALNFDDALYLLNERGRAMQEAVPLGEGSMVAVLGLDISEITKILKNFKKEECEIANDNANGQVIISGKKVIIDLLLQSFKEKKIKFIPLKVSAPFHCSLMKPAAKVMEEKIIKTSFKDPIIKIINNVTAKVENDSNQIKKLLIDQIFSTVKWRESIIYMFEKNVKNFVEIGPGKALTGMVKRTIKEKKVNCFSINTIADIESFINELKK